MKLHHFIATEVSAEGNRIQQLGKALAPVVNRPAPVTEVKLADIKKLEPAKKTAEVNVDGDLTQQIRDYAVDQMEHSPTCSHLHRKIRHYD